jgi:hypothetical protein
VPIGDIEPDDPIGKRQQTWWQRIPSAFAALRLMTKSHVQQLSPGVILRLKVLRLSTGPCNAFAKPRAVPAK